jgi:hypothetical protein
MSSDTNRDVPPIRPIERAAYITGILLIVSGIVHLGILLLGGGSWNGPLSMRKPATFGLSFGLTAINVTAVASLIWLRDRTRALLLGSFVAACVLETALVTLQAWRGVPSHFNVETRFDSIVAGLLAAGGFTLVAVIVLLTIAALRDRRALPEGLRVALRAGLVALVGAQVTGAAMIATGMRFVFGGDPQRAYALGGWLKPVHGVLMHGILVLPLLAWMLSRSTWDERRQARAVRAGVVVYTLLVMGAAIASAWGTIGRLV